MAKQVKKVNKGLAPQVKKNLPIEKTKQLPSASNRHWTGNSQWHRIALFLLGFLLYANTIGYDYVLDDELVISKNIFTQKGVEGMGGIFSKDTFYGYFQKEGKDGLVAGGRYRPFSLATFAVEVSMFGLTPGVHHTVNALLYGATAALLYTLLVLMLQGQWSDTRVKTVALVAAVLFTIHPIHTEAVANIKGRDEILALLGSLAALWCCFRAYDTQKYAWYIPALPLFLAAIMSKEHVVTMIALAPLAFYFFRSKWVQPGLLSFGVFGSMFGLYWIIRSSIIDSSLSSHSLELMNNPFLVFSGNTYVPMDAGSKLATIFYTLGKYVQLLFIPFPLTHDYYPRHIDVMTWASPGAILGFITYLGIGFLAVYGLLRRHAIGFAALFYLMPLFIVSNIPFPIGTNMSERFVYMPSVGFSLGIGLLAGWLLYRKQKQVNQLAYASVLGVGVLVFGAMTMYRNGAWKDNLTLFTTDVRTSSNSAKIRNAAGGILIDEALKKENEAKQGTMLQTAEKHLREAIRIHPTYTNAYLLLGNAKFHQKQYDEAIRNYEEILRINPDYTDAKNNIAVTYREAGRVYGEEKNDLTRAIQYLTKAYELKQDDYETNRLLGVAYGIGGRPDVALGFFQKAAELEPELAGSWQNLGNAYAGLGQMDKANEAFAKAKQLDPNQNK